MTPMSPTSISFIVPVYNVLRYLDECVSSLVDASREGDEIILVDDGSTDASGTRCDEWQQRQPFLISVIHQANGGLSAARNRGLASARNPYIYFLDSDDVLCSEHFDLIRAELASRSPDMLTCDALIWVDGTSLSQAKRVTHSLTPGPNADLHAVLQATFKDDFLATASRVYRADLLRSVGPDVFPPGKYYEDNATIPRLLLRAHHVVYLPTPIYRYRIRSGSITQSHSMNRCMDQAASLHGVLSDLQKFGAPTSVVAACNALAFKHLIMAVRNASRIVPPRATAVTKVLDQGLSGLTLKGAALLDALCKAPAGNRLVRHARRMLDHRTRYVAGRLLAGYWQWFRLKLNRR